MRSLETAADSGEMRLWTLEGRQPVTCPEPSCGRSMAARCRRLAMVYHDEQDLCLVRRKEDGGACYKDCYSRTGQW